MSKVSLQKFEAILKDGTRDSNLKRVLILVKSQPDTINGLMLRSGLGYSTITGRINELVEMGYVQYVVPPTGGQSWILYVDDEPLRELLRIVYKQKKFEKWEKLGKKMGWLG